MIVLFLMRTVSFERGTPVRERAHPQASNLVSDHRLSGSCLRGARKNVNVSDTTYS